MGAARRIYSRIFRLYLVACISLSFFCPIIGGVDFVRPSSVSQAGWFNTKPHLDPMRDTNNRGRCFIFCLSGKDYFCTGVGFIDKV